MNLLDRIAYDTGGYTVQEILSSFCKKILEIIDLVNKNEEVCDEAHALIENIRNEVVPELVDDIMKELQVTGYFDNLVNVTLIEQLRTEITALLNQAITDYTTRLDNFGSQLEQIENDNLHVNVKKFGAKGDGVTDDTEAIVNAMEKAVQQGKTLYFPKGVYLYSDLGNINFPYLKIKGYGDKQVTLKCINDTLSHNAITINAFTGGVDSPILFGVKLENLIIECNSNTNTGLKIQGYARLDLKNIYVKNLGGVNSKCFHILGCHESNFYNISHGYNYTGLGNMLPQYGLYIDRSTRGGIVEGSSTNNTFINCYFENCNTGIELAYADQNTFMTCASQGNEIGLKISPTSTMNNFIGMATEKNTSKLDIEDLGRTNNFINSYTEYTMKANGKQGNILGGKISNLVVGGDGYLINGIRVNCRGNDDGGFIMTGDNNTIKSILDLNSSVNNYVYSLPNRRNITVTDSPFTYTNTTGKMIEVICQSGTLTQVQKERNNSQYLVNNSTPNTYLLAPTEKLIIHYTDKPSVSYVEYNGY